MTTHSMPVTYSLWLNQQRHRDDPVGDLAREVAYDPHPVTTPTRLAWRIREEGGSKAAQHAAQRASTEWLATKPRNLDTPTEDQTVEQLVDLADSARRVADALDGIEYLLTGGIT